MNEILDRQRVIDEEHLRLLSIFHYISGALTLFVSLIFLLQFFLFSFIFDEVMSSMMDMALVGNYDFDPEIFSLLIYLWIFLFFIFIAFGLAQLLSGKYLRAKKHRIFSFIIAIVSIISFPYGTILGVMTIIVLSRSSIIELYR
jgi:hypothetical protein